MPTVQEILAAKGFEVHAVSSQATVLDAVHKMNDRKIGALVVMDDGTVRGIFTERDVLQRVIGCGLKPHDTRVADVMTTKLICVPPETDVEDVQQMMKQRRIRHVPVCTDDGDLLGVISIGDVNAHHV
ncbi:MAG TPA: CBS domain-containing protein, partial [Tepidisphaeraceae bacterium]|nr:CBS domain-containing protein [Tepidisphaeraceae bacterium]